MSSISETIAKLQQLGSTLRPAGDAAAPVDLVQLDEFGRNPGDLRALMHVPAGLPAGAPLVVVLHGFTQTGGAYDRGSGWSTLADRFGFAVLYPEQQRSNNANLCFNWFVPADTRRGGGEAESIREMVVAAINRHRLDASRVFVTGLSAGGAMTSVMLATHPDLFAAGAIIAGLPYGTATSIPEALERMRGHGHDRAALSERVHAATTHRGPWPAVSVWHGTADTTVSAMNAALIVEQWRGVHGVVSAPITDRVDRQVHRQWHDASGRVVVEEYVVAGLAHGTPLASSGDEACGVPGPHMLDAGISSTYRIAAYWGIAPASAPAQQTATADEAEQRIPRAPRARSHSFNPSRVINTSLRAAGLMKS